MALAQALRSVGSQAIGAALVWYVAVTGSELSCVLSATKPEKRADSGYVASDLGRKYLNASAVRPL